MDRVTAVRALADTPEGVEIECTGRSMEPTLRAGDRVRVRRGRAAPGDVVLFESHDGGDMILHRVVLLVPRLRWFVHCGDAGRDGGAGIARIDRIIGCADVRRRPPPLRSVLAASRAVLRAAWTRI